MRRSSSVGTVGQHHTIHLATRRKHQPFAELPHRYFPFRSWLITLPLSPVPRDAWLIMSYLTHEPVSPREKPLSPRRHPCVRTLRLPPTPDTWSVAGVHARNSRTSGSTHEETPSARTEVGPQKNFSVWADSS